MIGCWQTFASEKGKDWCVERIIYDDPVTHVSIQELTSADHAADNLYFHVSNFTADNHYLIFVSKRGKSAQLFRAEVDTGRLVQLTDESGIAAHTACPHPTDPQHIIYFRGHELFDLNIVDFSERKIGEIPPPRIGGFGQPSFTPDGRAIALAKQRDEANWEIGLMDLQTGSWRSVTTMGFPINHVQHSPTDPLIFYAWETGGYAPQRSWLVRDDGTANRPFYAPTNSQTWLTSQKEWLTHEAWVKDTGEMTMVNDKQGIMLLAREGSSRLISKGDYWHAAASADGKLIVADDMKGQLCLINAANGEKRLLATGLRDAVKSHSHASFDRLGHYLQFHSGRSHETVALIDLRNLP